MTLHDDVKFSSSFCVYILYTEIQGGGKQPLLHGLFQGHLIIEPNVFWVLESIFINTGSLNSVKDFFFCEFEHKISWIKEQHDLCAYGSSEIVIALGALLTSFKYSWSNK